MNNQQPEPAVKHRGETLDVHSIFYTIQGEGPFSGRPAVFIRLAGCNLRCPGCDTEYTEGRREMSLEQLLAGVRYRRRGCLVVITGGEPLRQPIGLLCERLNDNGYPVQIESNGVLPPDDRLGVLLLISKALREGQTGTTLVVSPKTSAINAVAAKCATAFKYVLDHRHVGLDGLPTLALEHPASRGVARPPDGFKGEIYLNPYDAKDPDANAKNLDAVVKSSMLYGYRMGIQLHKLLNLE